MDRLWQPWYYCMALTGAALVAFIDDTGMCRMAVKVHS
jgi:hypothetical protein